MAEDNAPLDTPSPRAGGSAPMPPLSQRGSRWRIFVPLLVLGLASAAISACSGGCTR